MAGRVRICVPPGMPPSFLAGHFAALAETHPELSIHLLVRDDPRTAIPLDADFAVVLGDPPTSGPSVLSVAVRPEVRLLASPGYIEQFGSPNTLSDLAQHRLAVWDHPSQPLQLLDQHGEAFTVSPWFLSNDMNLIREFARTGHAIAVVPDPGWSVASDAELVTLFPDTTHGTFPAWFLIPTAVLHSPRVQAVLEFSRTVADRP